MTARTLLRRVGRIGVPVGIAGAAVGLAAAPALAAAGIDVRSGSASVAGHTVTADSTLQATGTDTATDGTGLSKSRTLTLSVDRPGSAGSYALAASKSVRSNANGSISGALDLGCPGWSANPCVEAVNGSYVFRFSNGSTTKTTTVTVAVPPAAPADFTAAADGTVASFAWQPNSEPDLMGYDVVDADGTDVTPGGVDAASVCDASGCSVTVNFGSGAAGTSHTVHVLALRHTAPGSAGAIASAASASRTVTFPAAPTGSPSGGGGGGTGTGNGGGGHGSGGSGGSGSGGSGSGGGGTTSSGGTHRVTGKHPAVDLSHSLPASTAGAAPDLPSVLTEVKPLPVGTFKKTLSYPPQVVGQTVHKPVPRSVTASVVHDISQVFDTSGLWRGLGGAAVMLLVAAHLRAWLERTPEIE